MLAVGGVRLRAQKAKVEGLQSQLNGVEGSLSKAKAASEAGEKAVAKLEKAVEKAKESATELEKKIEATKAAFKTCAPRRRGRGEGRGARGEGRGASACLPAPESTTRAHRAAHVVGRAHACASRGALRELARARVYVCAAWCRQRRERISLGRVPRAAGAGWRTRRSK